MQAPEIFTYGEKVENNPYDELYSPCPIMLTEVEDGQPVYIHLRDYIRLLQAEPYPSADHRHSFHFPAMMKSVTLAPMHEQMIAHGQLAMERFDFSRFPLKLEKWDPVMQKWRLLTIDCQIVTAAFLVCLARNPDAVFEDTLHTHQKLVFKVEKVFKKNRFGSYTHELDHMVVSPTLVIGRIEERLRLTITAEVNLPELKFSTPAVMVPPIADFNCCICFSGADIAEDGSVNPVFRTGCGPQSGHCFHTHCMKKWLATGKSTCPECRTVIKHTIDSL